VPTPHSGLGLDVYVRVTSPLRRYLDLVAHQQLRAFVRGAAPMDTQAVLERVGAAEAITGSVAYAERLARQHWTLVYLLQHPGWRGVGVVVEAKGPRATILIPELAWETKIHLRRELPLNSTVTLALTGVDLPMLDAFFRVES
jgi:exoribonuclease-2